MSSDRLSEPTIFREFFIATNEQISTLAGRIVHHLQTNRNQLENEGISVMNLLSKDHHMGSVSPAQLRAPGYEHLLGYAVVRAFELPTARGFSICVSSSEPRYHVQFNYVVHNRWAPVLQFVSIPKSTLDT